MIRYYVDARNGNDNYAGTAEAPFRTVLRAALEAKKLLAVANGEQVEIRLRDGVHLMEKTVSLCGSNWTGALTVCADGGHPVVTSAKRLANDGFVKVEGKPYYTYQFEADESGAYPAFRDIYRDGNRVPIAKSPIYISQIPMENQKQHKDPVNHAGFYTDVTDLTDVDLSALAPMEFYIMIEWEFFVLHVDHFDTNDTKVVDGRTLARLKPRDQEIVDFCNRFYNHFHFEGYEYYYQNHPSLLTPDTFAYDPKTGTLYYYPAEDTDMATAELCMPTLEVLFDIRDARGVTVDGITFTGTTSSYLLNNIYCASQANGIYPGDGSMGGFLPHAAVLGHNLTGFTVKYCTFTDMGTHAVLLGGRAKDIVIASNYFEKIGMSAILVGDRVWRADDSTDVQNVLIENNYLHHIAFDYSNGVALIVTKGDNLKILRNTIKEVPYTGISIGWGWSVVDFDYNDRTYNLRNVEIAYNYIEDFMLKQIDGGGIYSLSANATVEDTAHFNLNHDNYVVTSTGKSRFRCIYLDGSSSNRHVYNVVASGGQEPLYSQWSVRNQYTHNNLFEDIYSPEPVSEKNIRPSQNNRLGNTYKADSLSELLEKYPEAKRIRDGAGSTLGAKQS